jgi:hypothetical protein
VAVYFEAGFFYNLVFQFIKVTIGENFYLAAVRTDEVVMVAGRLPHQVAAAAMAGVSFTNEAAFFQDFQGAVNSYQADSGVVGFYAFVYSGGGLVLVGADNLVNHNTALGGYFVAVMA